MAIVQTLLFETTGAGNTDATLLAALQRAEALGIRQMVIATTTGQTALQAADVFGKQGKIIGVHLSAGYWQKYGKPDPQIVAQAEAKGVVFLTCPHALMGSTDAALATLGCFPPSHVMANTYYTFSQGAKVAVECMLMAADANLLAMDEEVISIAGSSSGADTALVLTPAFPNDCFNLRVREIIAKPR